MKVWLADTFLLILYLASWIAIVMLGARIEQLNVYYKSLAEKLEILEQAQIDGGR
jgi:hypothetical protein